LKKLIFSIVLALASKLAAANVGNPVTIYPSGTPIPVSGTFAPATNSATTSISITAITGTGATSYFDKLTASATVLSDFALNAVTYASSVAGTSMKYLTLTTESFLFLGNDNTVPLYYVLTNSSTAPTNTATVRKSIPPGGLAISMRGSGGMALGYNFLHWFWPASSSATLTPTAGLGY